MIEFAIYVVLWLAIVRLAEFVMLRWLNRKLHRETHKMQRGKAQ